MFDAEPSCWPPDNPRLVARSRVPAWFAAVFAVGLVALRLGCFDTPSFQPSDAAGPLGLLWWSGLVLVVLAAIPRRVEVGAEGLLVGWLLEPRFVRYADVIRAAPFEESGLVVELGSGDVLHVDRTLFGQSPRALLGHLWQALSLGAETKVAPHESALLRRGARAVPRWYQALRGLSETTTLYRSALGASRLWAIAESPVLDAELRCAAAVAMATMLDEAGRSSLRALAHGSVVPEVRATFERVARGDDATSLEQALGAFDDAHR